MQNKDIKDIASQIINISNTIKDCDIDRLTGDHISRKIVKLATLRVNVGQALAQLGSEYDFAYIGRKLAYASEFKGFKGTNKEREMEAEESIYKIREKEMELKKQADFLKILYQSSATLISTLQSRLRTLEQERRETK